MFLLDTNVLSELRRHDRADANVVRWARGIDPSDLFISVITVLEIEVGALRIDRRDAVQGTILRRWIEDKVLSVFKDRILPVDAAVARRCTRLHVPDPRGERDALITATALVHRLRIVSRDVGDFEAMGVEVLNPWV
jgi:predicted nucleic acid-binding protein